MTDRERWLAFLDEYGIHHDESDWNDRNSIIIPNHHPDYPDKEGPNTGYSSFFTEIEFDATGHFIKIGAWE